MCFKRIIEKRCKNQRKRETVRKQEREEKLQEKEKESNYAKERRGMD